MLYPVLTQTRSLLDLNGIWNFCLGEGIIEPNYSDSEVSLKESLCINVPGSYNDVLLNKEIRNHVGWVWYQRTFSVPKSLENERIVLRFASVTHRAVVYLNGKQICRHDGGFTPFEVELEYNDLKPINDIRIAVRNIVDYGTLPVGTLIEQNQDNEEKGYKNNANFDFFNYCGIHRPVKIYSTPHSYIEDISTVTSFDKEVGYIEYSIKSVGDINLKTVVHLFDENQQCISKAFGNNGKLQINDVILWEPLNSYLYEMVVSLNDGDQIIDEYRLPVGIRSVEVKKGQFLINDKPFYFKGFGKHEDVFASGRGLNEPVNVLDFNLMKWMGANSFRTAHYPYSEEIMRLADREGIVVIDETPAVGLTVNFSATMGTSAIKRDSYEILETKEAHAQVIKELINRDKNHACVVMWSLANEPASDEVGAYEYFEPLVNLAKAHDPQKRPVTIVLYMMATPKKDYVAELCDVLAINRYYGWYVFGGDLKTAQKALDNELHEWAERCPDKPIIMTEYGADTVLGMRDILGTMFSEDYQVDFYNANHEIMDLHKNVVGEQPWNFSDFETTEGMIRVQGNKKGIFTRDRKPKSIAYELKKRWEAIPNYYYKKEE